MLVLGKWVSAPQVLAKRREAVASKTEEISAHANMFGHGATNTCPTGLARLETELASLVSEASEVEEACAALNKELEDLSDRLVDLMGDGPSSPLSSMLSSGQLESLRESLRKGSNGGEGESDEDDDTEDSDDDGKACMTSIIPVGECAGVQRIAASVEIFLGAMAEAERAAEEQAKLAAENRSSDAEDAPSLVGRIIGTLVRTLGGCRSA